MAELQETQTLARVTLFAGLEPAVLSAIVAGGREYTVPRGTFFFHQGEPADTFYVLLEGHARLYQFTPGGQQVIVHLLGPGEEIAIVAVISRIHYPVSAEASSDCRALSWSGEQFAQLMEAYPQLAINALQLVTARYLRLQHRYRELATERVEQRIAHTLLRLARRDGDATPEGLIVKFPISRQDIADLTGATLYTVSRVCSRWEQDGVIHTNNRCIIIKDVDTLRAIAESY